MSDNAAETVPSQAAPAAPGQPMFVQPGVAPVVMPMSAPGAVYYYPQLPGGGGILMVCVCVCVKLPQVCVEVLIRLTINFVSFDSLYQLITERERQENRSTNTNPMIITFSLCLL